MSTSVSASSKNEIDRAPLLVRSQRLLQTGWLQCLDSRAIAYVFFAVAYIIPNIVLARQKLMWDDEFFTLYLSKTASWSELWRALSTGADQHPPSFYYFTHLILEVAGTSHVTLRLTALIGFGLSCVCLYEIARQTMGRRWAVPALLLPLTTPALYYATEARGYGLELGFITFSLLMWILATEGKKRRWTVAALGFGLCLSVASHYYAVLILLPLSVGEFAKAKVRRTLDVPVCCALLGSLIPLILFAPIILSAKTYSAHFWAVPFWGEMVNWYPNMTGRMPQVLLAAAGLILVLRIPASDDPQQGTAEMHGPVAITLALSTLIPVAGMVIAQLVTRAYADRYFISALPGTCILLLWGLKRIVRNDTAGPAIATLLCIVLFVQEWRDLHRGQISSLLEMKSAAALLRQVGDAPIVVSEITAFYRLSFYGRRDLVNRLVYVADPHLSLHYLGHDTIDRGMLALTPWFPLRIVWWHEWWNAHPYSLVYGYVGEWTWVTFALREIGSVQVLGRDVSRLLLAVKRTAVPEDDRTPSDPWGKPMLFDQIPTDGPPLCGVYMPSDTCPVLDDPNFTVPIITYPDRR